MSKSSNLELRMKWEQRIADYKASGLTQVKWCEENHISIHQFKYWMKQIKRQQPQNKKLDNLWIPVVIEDPKPISKSDEPLRIIVNSVAIEVNTGFDPSLLLDVIKVLKENVN